MLQTSRLRLTVLLAGSLGVIVSGCSASLFDAKFFTAENFRPAMMDRNKYRTEQRVISQFTDALSEDNESAFRRVVSTRFEQKAMRSEDAYKDLEILSLPKTELEVVESKDLENDVLEVVAKEESGTKYQFRIFRDPEKHRWVVDDVLTRQQKKGMRATKSSVEVMDLLLTVREFLGIWESADRDAVLQAVSSDLGQSLQTLPEPWFRQVIKRISVEYETGMARHPEAQMNESDAVVQMPSKNGFLLMKVERLNDRWLVADIEVRNRKVDDHAGSVLRQSRAMHAVTRFLNAYKVQDHTELQQMCENKFYHNALRVGDLSMIALPSAEHAPDDFEIRSYAGQLTVVIPDKAEIVQMDLTTPEQADSPDGRKRESGVVEKEFVVSDVTIYDRQTQRKRNLKSAFTAPARAQLFLSALESLDLPMLKQISTQEFAESTWDKVRPELAFRLPLKDAPSGNMKLENSHVKGETTELEFLSSSGQICSVVMKEENGSLKVDDVHYPNANAKVASLKTQLMLSVPLVELADAWRRNDLQSIQQWCSTDFNRLVWSNLQAIPADFGRLPEMLLMPFQDSESSDQFAVVTLATPGRLPVHVKLSKENTAWVVDEISLRQSKGTVFEVRRMLRQEIAQNFLTDPNGGIQRAASVDGPTGGESGVIRAVDSVPGKRRGNLTMQSSGKPAINNTAVTNAGLETVIEAPRDSSASYAGSDDGTLHFGPGISSPGARERSVELPSGVQPRPAARTEEHDGVLHFNGATESPKPATAEDHPGDHTGITDPSQHPIDILLE